MDTKHLWRLLVVLIIAITGIVYVVVYRKVQVPMPLPDPSSMKSFEEHYENFIKSDVKPANREAVRSMHQYRV